MAMSFPHSIPTEDNSPMLPGFDGGLPGFTGGSAGPSFSEATSTYMGGDYEVMFSSPFIVGGEGNTATAAGQGGSTGLFMGLLIGGLAAWLFLKR